MTETTLTLGEARRVAVLSDLHGNGPAFEAALQLARTRGFDQLIILGDLLTYGVHPAQVLDLTHDAVQNDGAVMVRGNHDDLYFELLRGASTYYDKMRDWIRESADWTLANADMKGFYDDFEWVERVVLGDVFFALATPFTYGDWTYLNKPPEFRRAHESLREQGFKVGVFGHTHRPKAAIVRGAEVQVTDDRAQIALSRDGSFDTAILNPGSVGQPRRRKPVSTVLFLDAGATGLRATFSVVDYDMPAHIEAIRASSLSETTQQHLLRYFRT